MGTPEVLRYIKKVLPIIYHNPLSKCINVILIGLIVFKGVYQGYLSNNKIYLIYLIIKIFIII